MDPFEKNIKEKFQNIKDKLPRSYTNLDSVIMRRKKITTIRNTAVTSFFLLLFIMFSTNIHSLKNMFFSSTVDISKDSSPKNPNYTQENTIASDAGIRIELNSATIGSDRASVELTFSGTPIQNLVRSKGPNKNIVSPNISSDLVNMILSLDQTSSTNGFISSRENSGFKPTFKFDETYIKKDAGYSITIVYIFSNIKNENHPYSLHFDHISNTVGNWTLNFSFTEIKDKVYTPNISYSKDGVTFTVKRVIVGNAYTNIVLDTKIDDYSKATGLTGVKLIGDSDTNTTYSSTKDGLFFAGTDFFNENLTLEVEYSIGGKYRFPILKVTDKSDSERTVDEYLNKIIKNSPASEIEYYTTKDFGEHIDKETRSQISSLNNNYKIISERETYYKELDSSLVTSNGLSTLSDDERLVLATIKSGDKDQKYLFRLKYDSSYRQWKIDNSYKL